MAITGNIKTFYLSSLLQLLSHDKKTGILELTDGNDIVQVYFRDGTIINAFGSSRVERLTNYLRSEGIVSAAQIEQCLAVSAHTGKKIGKILVEQGLISEDLLESLLHRQIEQTLFSLFLWEQGEFEYRDQEFDLSDQVVTSFDTMGVVLEASRRVDEISQIKKRVLQDADILAVTPNSEALKKASLNTAERAVLSLVNGRRTVKRLITDSGYDELKVYKTLFSLVTAGLVVKEQAVLKRPAEAAQAEVIAAKPGAAAGPNEDVLSRASAEQASRTEQPAESIGKTPESIFAAPEEPAAKPEAGMQKHVEPQEPQGAGEPAVPGEVLLDLEPHPEPEVNSDDTPDTPQDETLPDADADDGTLTVIKIDGRIMPEIDLSDFEPPAGPKLEPVDKEELAAALRSYGEEADFEEDERASAGKKRRRLILAASIAGGVVFVAVLLLVLLPVFSPEPSVQPSPQKKTAAVKPASEKKTAKAPPAGGTDVRPPQKTAPEAADGARAVSPEQVAEFDFFQDRKGWVSINLPSGYSVEEKPLQDRVSAVIRYGEDVVITISVLPDPSSWNAEDEMYASILKMQESASLQIQKYDTLKQAGCPGYMLRFAAEREQKTVQTAIYRFVCLNKSARLEIVSLTWRTEAGQQLCGRIYRAVETSFFIYP